jgi:hypothetical protein
MPLQVNYKGNMITILTYVVRVGDKDMTYYGTDGYKYYPTVQKALRHYKKDTAQVRAALDGQNKHVKEQGAQLSTREWATKCLEKLEHKTTYPIVEVELTTKGGRAHGCVV